jgi:hypothetical protein
MTHQTRLAAAQALAASEGITFERAAMTHDVIIDTFVSNDGQAAYRAYCNTCEWQEDGWNHEDTDTDAYGVSLASAAAHAESVE